MWKPPDNAHWSAAMMADVVDRAEESVWQSERVAAFVFSDEQKD